MNIQIFLLGKLASDQLSIAIERRLGFVRMHEVLVNIQMVCARKRLVTSVANEGASLFSNHIAKFCKDISNCGDYINYEIFYSVGQWLEKMWVAL